MASRSFKPASYRATAQPSKPSHHQRPSFTRTSSASSTHSEDSFIATLRNLSSTDKKEAEPSSSFGSSCGATTPGSTSAQQSFLDDTPSRKRSQPIAIEIPARERGAYTPLSARGDLPGGYFPNHETIQNKYKSHPFSRAAPPRLSQETEDPPSPSPGPMSNTSSAVATPEDITPRAPNLALPLPVPETPLLTMPMGKYHPSNYKLVAPTSTAPTSSPIQAHPPTSLKIPKKSAKRTQPHHERRTSDVKRKLQQYQRDMIAQARLASSSTHRHGYSSSGGGGRKPDSPKLMPLGSPGPITPFELEESAGYLVAGARASTQGGGLQGGERERELVGRMIREEGRRMGGSRSGPGSPVLI